MSSKFPYLKAFIVFPLILQILGMIIGFCLNDNIDETFTVTDLIVFYFSSTFFIATIQAFLIAIWARPTVILVIMCLRLC